MLDWPLLTGLLSVLFIAWLLIQVFLKGPKLLAYDHPIADSRAGSRDHASPENQEALRLLEQASAEIRSVPRKQRLDSIRQVLARGFC